MPTTVHGKLTLEQIADFLSHPLLARIATAVPSRADPAQFQPHVVPVWFEWDGESLWISAFQSTRKVKEVKRNPYVSILIDINKPIDGMQAILLEGKSELVLDPAVVQDKSRRIYTHYMGEEGVKAEAPQSWIVDPENSIIKLTPRHIYTW